MTHDHMMQGKQPGMMTDGLLPQESGHSAFATIQEIVTMLAADPATDGSKVNI